MGFGQKESFGYLSSHIVSIMNPLREAQGIFDACSTALAAVITEKNPEVEYLRLVRQIFMCLKKNQSANKRMSKIIYFTFDLDVNCGWIASYH
jgi:hypothetical protein